MAETYYSLTDIVKLCDNLIAAMPTSFYSGIMTVRTGLANIPAADVVPVRHGRWDDKVVAFYRKCSECGCCVEWNKKPFLFGDGDYNFCPNCGANMRDNTQKTSVDEEVKHG